MENIPVFGQAIQLLASGIILLALCLGIIFYIWSINIYKRIELLTINMKRNIDSLENLSQLIYEKAYSDMEKKTIGVNKTQEKSSVLSSKNPDIQDEIDEKVPLFPAKDKDSETRSSLKNESQKYQDISKLILQSLNELLEEKEQVTAQELIYAIPNDYPLADIYQTLEDMKERNQISWKDKNVSPQLVLKLQN